MISAGKCPCPISTWTGHSSYYTFTPVIYPKGLTECWIKIMCMTLLEGLPRMLARFSFFGEDPPRLRWPNRRKRLKPKRNPGGKTRLETGSKRVHKISKPDAEYLLKSMEEDSGQGFVAGLILDEAVEAKKLFPLERLLSQTEKQSWAKITKHLTSLCGS